MEKILRSITWLGSYEVTNAILPWFFVSWFVQFWAQSPYVDVALKVIAAYWISTAVIGTLCKKWSSRYLKLKRFMVMPIPRWFAVFLIRGRMLLPKGKRYFIVHIRSNRLTQSLTKELREDIEKGLQSKWAENTVFIGNTFGSFGRRQWILLKEFGLVEVVNGTFFPAQTWFLNLKRYQKKMFGRALSQNAKWKIIKVVAKVG